MEITLHKASGICDNVPALFDNYYVAIIVYGAGCASNPSFFLNLLGGAPVSSFSGAFFF